MADKKKGDKKNGNTLVHDTICLTVITLVAGVLLGGVYTLTKKPIEKQDEIKKQQAYEAVFAGASFEEDAGIDSKREAFNEQIDAGKISAGGSTLSDVTLSEVLRAKKDGEDAGYVVTCSGKGYGGQVTIALGIDSEGTIQGIQITDCADETPGLGQNSQNKDWNSQFIGMNKEQDIQVVKDGTGSVQNGSIDAISGATITSKAVTAAINGTLQFIGTLE